MEGQLLRLNKVSVSTLFEIKQRFVDLDIDGSGYIDRQEITYKEATLHQPRKMKEMRHAFKALRCVCV